MVEARSLRQPNILNDFTVPCKTSVIDLTKNILNPNVPRRPIRVHVFTQPSLVSACLLLYIVAFTKAT